jgi:class 3 adenylate cyclase
MSMLKKAASCLVAGLVTFSLVHFISTGTKLFDTMDNSLMDGFFYLRDPAPFEENPFLFERVRLIGFDEDSLAIIGKWPWKRYVHARFLDKIERYSPETVFFDIIFAKPEAVPDFVDQRLDVSEEALDKFTEAFAEMDKEFSQALSRYDNVYLDLQLMPEERPGLPDTYIERIRHNEDLAAANGLPAGDVMSSNIFHSLEPVLDDFADNAHPTVINVYPDDDGVVRFFPFYYTYQKQDGSYYNLLTIVSSLLQHLYHLPTENISIEEGKVVLHNAKVPVLHPKSRKQRRTRHDFSEINKKIINPDPPENYNYNRNLYHYLINQIQLGYSSVPDYPLHVLALADDNLEIVDGWEVLAAARKAGSQKIDIVSYEQKDVEIKTPLGNFFYINYAGKETKIFTDEETGEKIFIPTTPTEGYKEIYTLPEVPDLPLLTANRTLADPDALLEVAPWFFNFCEQKFYQLYGLAEEQLTPEEMEDDAAVLKVVGKDPDSRFFYYYYFFLATEAAPEQLPALIDAYPDFGREIGQDEDDFLSEQQIVDALNEHYGMQFDRYYNKFIFAGASALGLADVHTTPYDKMFGPNIIINAFNTIATDNQLTMSVDVPGFDFKLLLLLCAFFSLAYGFANIRHGSYVFLVLFIGTFVSSYFLFSMNNFYLRTTPLLIANIVIFVEMVIYKLLTEEKDKKFLKANFSHYLAPELIDEMHRNHSMPKLGGELKNITAYFTDIQGFSTFSEKLTATQLVELLNEYLAAMTDILLAEKGTLDKYEGDAIIAFLGAPHELPDHSLRACRVAIAMQKELLRLRQKWAGEKQSEEEEERNTKQLPADQWAPGDKWPTIVHGMLMRIGINTGDIVVGNMGSAIRKNYTMMGDAVNLAARLEEAAKQYGVYTLISDFTLEKEFIDEQGNKVKTRDFVELRYLDKITVVGKSEPVKVYELCAMKGELTEQEKELFRIFDQGMEYYLNMEWDKAIAKFRESLPIERVPEGKTTPSEVFIKRCEMFKENPPVEPGRKWDGVFRLTKK